ncbi:GDP-L-fucose synthase [Paramuricea clavata]|uniref:GDP-L-fucose synthase n=1 Tax=Paramuricea clavata TaxID=317549 RepID=A0A7D9LHK1_PARCT|nr:GDP-L-fucose synthase [Paramuricea clavata]
MDAQYDFCYQNLLLGMNVIQAAYQAGITKLINLASSCAYPKNAENPIKESQLLQGLPEPTNQGYAIAKATVAHLTTCIALQYGLQYKTYIPCNLYGYWDNYDANNSHFIAAIIKKIHRALEEQQANVVIWGDGNPRREVLFTEDLADFILFSLQNFSNIPNIINVGSGIDCTINEYYQIIAKVLDYKGTFSHDLTKPNGIKQKLMDISKLKALGWQPKTSLEACIRKAYKFYIKEALGCSTV